ncbi:hypothetical protein BV22DRAFT_1034819 [Leucogyrophana mollusca]|uniref:Uncharacterized protein n=1 Tax=Leucogyrophana mollusca TaxID=85980 RepID=A0ACB8BJN8_9AGAM|nr:hypothetical protein BV22DRAFT_1034819 [Leucogyrophana mollusca]
MGCSQNLIYTPTNPRHPYQFPGVHMPPHRTPGEWNRYLSIPSALIKFEASPSNSRCLERTTCVPIESRVSLSNLRHLERTTCVSIGPQASSSISRYLKLTSSDWNESQASPSDPRCPEQITHAPTEPQASPPNPRRLQQNRCVLIELSTHLPSLF